MSRSPRRLRQQVQDAVNEQVRDLPVHAVRLAMFGFGRALLLSDRLTRDYKEMKEDGVTPVLHRLRGDAQHSAVRAGQAMTRVVDRVRGGEQPPPEAAEERGATPPDRRADPDPAVPVAPPRAEKSAAETVEPVPDRADSVEPPAAEPLERSITVDSLPVPDYDSATLPQLRARLRGLSVDQVTVLCEYERAHAARPEVVRMFENRVAKLNALSG